MNLSDEIERLRGQVVAELISAHDYYVNTQIAWRIVRGVISAGSEVTLRNATTGTVTTDEDLVVKARGYVINQLPEATFQQFVAIFESFVFDLLGLWLIAHPRNLGRRMVEFGAILDLPDKAAITDLVVRKELNELLYKRPADWFAYLDEKAKLGCPTAIEIDRIAEAKASRDVLVHGKGIASRSYEFKAGKLARCREGDRLTIPEPYHRETWELIRKVVGDVSDAAIAKAS